MPSSTINSRKGKWNTYLGWSHRQGKQKHNGGSREGCTGQGLLRNYCK